MEDSDLITKEISNPLSGLIICGTDTDVGKTIISAFILQGLNATYWKPIQSGMDGGGDTSRIYNLLNLSKDHYLQEAYQFLAPVSPHWAAEKEKRLINQSKLKLPSIKDFLIVETAGGLMVPLRYDFLQIDQIKCWNLPVVLVTRTSLGTLNHTLLSIEAMKKRQIPILGIIMNGEPHSNNSATIQEITHVPIIGELPYLDDLTAASLENQWNRQNLGETFQKLIQGFKYINNDNLNHV